MKDISKPYLKQYKQFHIRFEYENKKFARHCIVPMHYTLKDVRKSLNLLFKKETFVHLKCIEKPVLLLNEKNATLKKFDGTNVSLHWRDGIKWEVEMTINKKITELLIVTEMFFSEKKLLNILNEIYPCAEDISTLDTTDCWIKNTVDDFDLIT